MVTMKTSLLLCLLSALYADHVAAQCPLTDAVGATFTFSGTCTAQNVQLGLSAVHPDCNLASVGQDIDSIEDICEAAAIPFGDISDMDSYQFDKNFMDGGGAWNTEDETVVPMSASAGRIGRFAQYGADYRIQWPKYDALWDYSNPVDPDDESDEPALLYPVREPYMSNFNLTDSCELRTAMCCFIESRRSDIPLDPNTKLCHHNIEDSKRSSHLNKGFAVYDETTPANCVGFSWDSSPDSVSNLYKGNALFDISYRTFFDQGMRKNVPGAPMCGCVEKMPVVKTAHCKTLIVTGVTHRFSIAADVNGDPLAYVEQTGGKVDYIDCPNGDSLKAHFNGGPDEQIKLDERLPGQCTATKKDFLNKRFLVQGTTSRFTKPDSTIWEAMYGRGLSYVPRMSHPELEEPYDLEKEDAFFRSKLSSSTLPKIIYRHCESCLESHRHIFYKRLTLEPPTTDDYNYLDNFLSNWVDEDNEMGEDFELYSNLSDALNGRTERAWKYCDYNDSGVGFPNECGPEIRVYCQWSTHLDKRICSGNQEYSGISHAFYVMRPGMESYVNSLLD